MGDRSHRRVADRLYDDYIAELKREGLLDG
jgi:hypothetical protein